MKASLDVAGIEVELSVPPGTLEAAIATRYARFLGSVQTPACTLRIEPSADLRTVGPSLPAVAERVGPSRFDVAHQSFRGSVDLEGDGMLWTADELSAADAALGIVFALLAPEHDGILMDAAGVIRAGRAGIFLGPATSSMVGDGAEHRPSLGHESILVRRLPNIGWVAAATPFGANRTEIPPPRMAALERVWLSGPPGGGYGPIDQSDLTAEVSRNAVIPTPDPGVRDSVLGLAHQLVAAVPTAELTDRGGGGPGSCHQQRFPAFRYRSASMAAPGSQNPEGVTTP